MLLLYYLWGFGAGAAGAPPPSQWYPIYADRSVRPRPHPAWGWSSVGPILPIPNALPPVPLAWLTTSPSRIAIPRPRAGVAGGAKLMPPYAPLPENIVGWFPATPPINLSRRWVFAGSGNFPWGTQPAIAQAQEWRPRLPDQRLAKRLLGTAGSVMVLPPDLTGGSTAVSCVEWTDETFTQPLLTAETVVSPSMTAETLVQPLLTAEDLC